jgi:Ca-activated chloride channel family protein
MVYLASHHVDVEIDNQVATTRIEQVFVNETARLAEGTYLFPLPKGATVSDLVMWVDGQPIQAKILGADEARGIYEQIVRQLRDPALLEYVGQDAIQANIFPIQPHDDIKIEIEYSHILPVENGLVRYVYPLRSDQFTPLPVGNLSIRVHVVSNDKIGSVYSPTHRIIVDREGDYEFTAGFETTYAREAGNFNLYYSLASDNIDVNLLTYRESAREDGFFLLLVAPPVTVDESEILPKDVIVVLDQSGSMFGEKWDQAREAAKFVLDNLNREDRFNVVAFSTGTRIYANDLQSPREAEDAKDWIDSLEAIGGTEIDAALRDAFDIAKDSDRQTVILFLTDGVPTEGETDTGKILEEVRENAPANVRIFSFGVGDDVDTFLLDTLSTDFQGTSAYVRPNERIDEEVAGLYNKVSSPVMTDIEIDFGSINVEDLYPGEPLPDLFVGSQLIIAGRYRDSGTTDITLTGRVNGERQTITYENLEFRENAGGEASIPRLWATRKIGALLNSIRLHGESDELVDSIVRLSTRYGIITPYTSFLIEENDIFTAQGRDEAFEQAGRDLDALDDTASGGFAVGAADAAISLEEAEVAQAPMPQTIVPADKALAGNGGLVANEPMSATEINAYYDSIQPIQVIGSRTFLFREGTTWIDSTYDASTMELTEVIFLSDEYFDLLDEYPEVGQYLTLGEHIILVIEGMAYEIKPE